MIVFTDLHGLLETRGSAESSVYVYLRPGQVRTERLARGYTGPVDDAVLQRMFTGGVTAISQTGVMGDPHGALQRHR